MPRRKSVAIAIALASITVIALLVNWLSPRDNPDVAAPATRTLVQQADRGQREIPLANLSEHALEKLKKRYFNQVVLMLHAKQYDYAVTALHELLEIAPKMPEAHVNMGFALLGLERYQAASDFFNTALQLNPQQINAYYGLALAEEKLDHIAIAVASMESFIHRSPEEDPYLDKARDKISAWRQKMDAERIEKAHPGGEPKPESDSTPAVGKDSES